MSRAFLYQLCVRLSRGNLFAGFTPRFNTINQQFYELSCMFREGKVSGGIFIEGFWPHVRLELCIIYFNFMVL